MFVGSLKQLIIIHISALVLVPEINVGYFLEAGEKIPSKLNSQQSNKSNVTQYWRRPGCYKLGHTRVISIPGCVKFNLSTNACRGYCLSYSIPANEDLGPEITQTDNDGQRIDELMEGQQMTLQGLGDELTSDKLRRKSLEDRMLVPLQEEPKSLGLKYVQVRDSVQVISMAEPQLMSSRMSPTLAEPGNKRRDVVSVSQCCNMMDTEDVIVDLRCNRNETRRLIFKSAKTCECFFCKHLYVA